MPSRNRSYKAFVSSAFVELKEHRGATQQGVMDMAGNVWGWCQNTYENPGPPEAVRLEHDWLDQRVIRGGSWRGGTEYSRTSIRCESTHFDLYDDIGFRLAQDI